MEDVLRELPLEVGKYLVVLNEQVTSGLVDTSPYSGPEWKGHRFPMIFNSDTAKMLHDEYKFREHSVIISAFAKTGSIWMSEIVRQILYGFDEKLNAITQCLNPLLLRLEAGEGKKMEIWKYIPVPRHFFRTHLPAPLLNLETIRKTKSKIIVLIRNPKDTAVSWYNFCKGQHFDPIREHLNPDWSQFFLDYVQGKQPIPVTKPGEGYAEFLLGWYEHENEPNVLFVHFENIKRNPINEIQRVAEFLDVNLSREQIEIVAERTSFQAMKEKQDSASDLRFHLRKKLNHLQKGQIGTWKDVFTVAQSEMMDKLMEKKLAGTNIKFIY